MRSLVAGENAPGRRFCAPLRGVCLERRLYCCNAPPTPYCSLALLTKHLSLLTHGTSARFSVIISQKCLSGQVGDAEDSHGSPVALRFSRASQPKSATFRKDSYLRRCSILSSLLQNGPWDYLSCSGLLYCCWSFPGDAGLEGVLGFREAKVPQEKMQIFYSASC